MNSSGNYFDLPREIRGIKDFVFEKLNSILDAKATPNVTERLLRQLLTAVIEETKRFTKAPLLRRPGEHSTTHEGMVDDERSRIGERILRIERDEIDSIREEVFGSKSPPFQNLEEVPQKFLKDKRIKRAAVEAFHEWGVADEEYRDHILTGSAIQCPPAFTRVFMPMDEDLFPPYWEYTVKINTPKLKWRHIESVCREIYNEHRLFGNGVDAILEEVLNKIGPKPGRGKVGDYFKQMATEWELLSGLPVTAEAVRKRYERSQVEKS